MSFLSGVFLTALVAAAGPTLIHLLNRRRRRTIYWAPMEFLREAIRRNRRVLQLRDLLLLLLRTVAVVLFVLAMARPFWLAGEDEAVSDQPVHAVLVIDNSLSMGYAQLDKSLLDVAKEKARTFIESLPEGSEISVIPLCSYSEWHARNVYSAPEDALEALARIEVVDRSAPVSAGFAQAQRASRLASDIPTKRVVFLGDAQQRTWSLDGVETYLGGIGDVQIVQVSPAKRMNTWVADFKLLHGIADTGSTAVFRATICHRGPRRDRVRVTLTIGEAVAAERYVDLLPGHNLQLDFHHKFDVAGTSAEPLFVPAKLELSPDRLPMDDQRALIVPVVAQVPVIFIDQYGRSERPQENLFGETRPLRRLLASGSQGSPEPGQKQLVKEVHRTIHELTRDELAEARLVTIAGVRSPTPEAVSLLREYVEQGGNILLAAGAEFDPAQWSAAAWLDGNGILPVPLEDAPLGKVPQPYATDVSSFRLDKASVVGEALYLDTTPEETGRILEAPLFFKAVVADLSGARKAIADVYRKHIEKQRDWLARYERNEERWAREERAGKLSAQDAAQREKDRLTYAAMNPRWLAWSNPLAREPQELSVEELVKAAQPQAMGLYDNDHPFAVQRDIGKGRVVLVTTGVWPSWNTLALDNGVLLLDRVMRSLMVRSLPDRTFGPENEILIPVDPADQAVDFAVRTPRSGEPQLQSVEALGSNSYGLLLRSIQQRGLYWIRRQSPAGEPDAKKDAPALVLAVNGPPEESELASLTEEDVPEKIGATNIRWVDVDEEISLAGKTYVDPDFWKVLMALVLGCLLLEMVVLAAWRLASAGAARPTERFA